MSTKSHYKGVVHPVHAMNAEQHQTAADPWTKPCYLSHRPACRQLGNYTHHRHLLSLSVKADTHFYHSAEGRRLSRPIWLVTYLSAVAKIFCT